jgi:predicted RNase H-like HicB family nuclease
MERIIRLQIEKLPEGVYLATSEDVQGLVAQANTLRELLDLVPELVSMLDEIRAEEGFDQPSGTPVPLRFELPFVLAA